MKAKDIGSTRTKIRFVFCVFTLFMMSDLVSAQNSKPDSLKRVVEQHTKKDTLYLNDLLALAIQTRNSDFEKAREYFAEAIDLSRKLSHPKFEIRSLNGMGICFGMQEKNAEAIRYFNEAVQLALDNNYLQHAGDTYNSLGIVYKNMGDYPTSLLYCTKSLQLYDSLGDEYGVASAYSNMGILFDLMKEPDKAMEHYQKSLELDYKNNDEIKIARVTSNIALLYLQEGAYQKAIEIYEKNLDYYIKEDIRSAACREMGNLGDVFYKINDFEKAESYLLSSIAEAENLQLDEIKVNALCTLGKLKADAGNIIVDGDDITHMGMDALVKVRMKFGLCFQDGALFDSMNVFENVAFPLRARKANKALIAERVAEVLGLVGLVSHVSPPEPA